MSSWNRRRCVAGYSFSLAYIHLTPRTWPRSWYSGRTNSSLRPITPKFRLIALIWRRKSFQPRSYFRPKSLAGRSYYIVLTGEGRGRFSVSPIIGGQLLSRRGFSFSGLFNWVWLHKTLNPPPLISESILPERT